MLANEVESLTLTLFPISQLTQLAESLHLVHIEVGLQVGHEQAVCVRTIP